MDFNCIYLATPCAVCSILVPQPGIEPIPLAVEAQSPNHWTAREVPWFFFGFVLFFIVDLYEFFKNIFWLQVPYQIYELQIFSPIVWIVFLLSWCCPLKHKFLILMKTSLFFHLLLMLLVLYLRNHCLSQDDKDILLCFLLRVLQF